MAAVDNPSPYVTITKGGVAGSVDPNNEVAGAMGIITTPGKMAQRGGMGKTMVDIGSSTVAAEETSNWAIGGVIKDPVDALGEGKEETEGVDPGIDICKAMFARSIKGSDILDISSRSPDRSNRSGRSSGCKHTSAISNLPSIIDTMRK